MLAWQEQSAHLSQPEAIRLFGQPSGEKADTQFRFIQNLVSYLLYAPTCVLDSPSVQLSLSYFQWPELVKRGEYEHIYISVFIGLLLLSFNGAIVQVLFNEVAKLGTSSQTLAFRPQTPANPEGVLCAVLPAHYFLCDTLLSFSLLTFLNRSPLTISSQLRLQLLDFWGLGHLEVTFWIFN